MTGLEIKLQHSDISHNSIIRKIILKTKKYLKESSSLSSFAASNKAVVSAANASFKSAPSTEVPVASAMQQTL